MNFDVAAFEKSVCDSLKNLLMQCARSLDDVKCIGVAVSGGADSVCLLSALASGFENSCDISKKFVCITVDHSIRPNDEGAADADFVKKFCEKIGVRCVEKKIPEGEVVKAAAERARGIEEAARFLRYEAFEEAAAHIGAEFVCLAHNKNDALETLLMRFLQGSAAAGISPVRGKYLRPLLQIEREKIEEYLREKKIAWHTDSTNACEKYLRNKIRLKLIPFLKENFAGFENAVLRGGEKLSLQNAAIEDFALKCKDDFFPAEISKVLQKEICFSAEKFSGLPLAIRQEFVFEAMAHLGAEGRVPYSFVRTLSLWPEIDFKKISFSRISARTEGEKLFFKICEKQATESGFFVIINEEGVFDFDGFSIEVRKMENRADFALREIFVRGKNSACLEMPLPFVVRKFEIGDAVFNAAGAEKSVADIFSDWKIPERERWKIPVLECGFPAKIFAVLGCVLGYENWIVAQNQVTSKNFGI